MKICTFFPGVRATQAWTLLHHTHWDCQRDFSSTGGLHGGMGDKSKIHIKQNSDDYDQQWLFYYDGYVL